MTSKSYKRLKQVSNDKLDKHRELTPVYDFLNIMNFFIVLFIILLILYLL